MNTEGTLFGGGPAVEPEDGDVALRKLSSEQGRENMKGSITSESPR
ncbi:hypothetical protein FM101_10305 [Arthrobacter rhombi]|uniref:Uncharacterized protein n=1 Tax=Arthrobacter rhombi TaxID=71253 RepID=A0A1R4GG54_9MICC|nr:hypothetical protein FM101_10305 [Arthrobacter rhombi]